MDIRKIEAFSKVYEYHSFSKAGKALYLSQPTISAHVASLEQELEVQLFDRIGRTVVPTKAGEILYQHAKKIFEASELALSEIRNLQDRITGKLDLGGSTIPSNYILPKLLASFWKRYPEVMMDLRIGDSEEIIEQVKDNTLMVGVVGGIFDSPDLHFEPIAEDRLVLVMAPALYNEFSHLHGVDFLTQLPWIMREDGSGTKAAMESSLRQAGVIFDMLKCTIVVRNAGAMAQCLAFGMGAAITSYVTVHHHVQSGELCVVDIPDLQMKRFFYVVFNKRRSLFPAALRLIDYLKSNLMHNSKQVLP
jgi:DNA-binding transcriptional LysR family regulator